MGPKQVQCVNLYMAIGLLTLLLLYDYIIFYHSGKSLTTKKHEPLRWVNPLVAKYNKVS